MINKIKKSILNREFCELVWYTWVIFGTFLVLKIDKLVDARIYYNLIDNNLVNLGRDINNVGYIDVTFCFILGIYLLTLIVGHNIKGDL